MNRSDFKDKLIAQLIKAGCTVDGAAYVRQAVDPFPDNVTVTIGYPDSNGGLSFVRDIRTETVLSAPASAAGANWDCHLCFVPATPINTDGFVFDLSGSSITYAAEITTNNLIGLLMACMVPSGTATFNPDTVYASDELVVLGQAKMADLSKWTRGRMIGGGFEVHNTTAEIEKQGAVTYYSFENNCHDGAVPIINSGGAQKNKTIGNWIAAPPQTLEQAKINGGVSREARDGALVVYQLQGEVNPATYPVDAAPVLVSTETTPGAGTYQTWYPREYQLEVASIPLVRNMPYMGHGAYFTGLSTGTTLDVIQRVLFEEFPAPSSNDMTIARPSPSADAIAIELLMSIQNELLPGYPVHDNAAGDFFRNILKTARTVTKTANAYAPMVAQIAPPQYRQAILAGGELAGSGARLGDAALQLTKNQKKKRRQRNKIRRNGPQAVREI